MSAVTIEEVVEEAAGEEETMGMTVPTLRLRIPPLVTNAVPSPDNLAPPHKAKDGGLASGAGLLEVQRRDMVLGGYLMAKIVDSNRDGVILTRMAITVVRVGGVPGALGARVEVSRGMRVRDLGVLQGGDVSYMMVISSGQRNYEVSRYILCINK
jgi:hypothetical protein